MSYRWKAACAAGDAAKTPITHKIPARMNICTFSPFEHMYRLGGSLIRAQTLDEQEAV
jgi:hypothetical protein